MEIPIMTNTDQFQELITCVICHERYKDPRILPCSHTFCYKCIQKSMQDGKFTCPLQDEQIIEQNDIDNLPTNRTAKEMVDFVLHINPSLDKKAYLPCENCNELQAWNWCEKCGTNLCETCTQSVHMIKIFQSHVIVPLASKVLSFCSEHSEEKFKYWCTQCNTLVCRDCLLFKHKDHTFLPTKDAADEVTANFEKLMQEVNGMKRNLMQFSTTMKNAIERQREVVRHEMQEAAHLFANLQRLLEERKCALIKELEDRQVETMKILAQQQMKVDEHLKLTTVQEFCIRKMLDSSDPIQILKFKSTLAQNYQEFSDQYHRIDEGCIIQRHMFKRDDKDLEHLADMILRLGNIKSKSYVVKKDGVTVKTIPLDLSKISDNRTDVISKEQNIARGYKLLLKQPMKLRSIRVHSDHIGQLVGFIVDENNNLVQKGVINSVNSMMKWVTIPVECELKNNYGVLVLPPSNNGSYTYKNGDNQFRKVNENCSVKSRLCSVANQLILGSPLTVINNTHSISMIIDVEE
ncbi:unnamed protein product [Adineta ricciae]|uniref:Uncharacterized protein n=1 Tax=Adineta ricciae TaxID=249248 RepID=A0A814LD13_ADIRI|nr:unnamed protein product [Adineta ricciae]CAF1117422.1 unnamed protein product [Adineta ricciae]